MSRNLARNQPETLALAIPDGHHMYQVPLMCTHVYQGAKARNNT